MKRRVAIMAAVAAVGVGTIAGLAMRPSVRHEDFGSIDDRDERDDDRGDGFTPSVEGERLILELCAQAQIPSDIARFLSFVAYGESRWNPKAGTGDPSLIPSTYDIRVRPQEADAAARAYERRADVLADCGHPREHYTFGSGGLFGALPTYWVVHLRGTPLRCASPLSVFDPPFALVGAYSFARGVTQHPSYEGTVMSLRAGWGSLRRMGDADLYAHKLPKWRKHAAAMGLPVSYVGSPAPQFPKRDLYDMYRMLQGGGGLWVA